MVALGALGTGQDWVSESLLTAPFGEFEREITDLKARVATVGGLVVELW